VNPGEGERQLSDILRTLSPEQLRFVAARMYERSDRAAALECGLPPSTVYGWENLDEVRAAVHLAQLDGVHVAQERLRRLMDKAVDVLADEMDGKSRNAKRLEAAIEVLDRVMGKAVQRNEVSGKDGGPVTLAVVERIVRADD
jgi:CRISPR/Cas system CSM-associated protein Csm2 small subunit